MSTFRVPVTRLRAVEPIPNADAIELAVVGDFRSVARRGQFAPGDLAAYLPEGALLPGWLLRQLGLWDEAAGKGRLAGAAGDRVKAIRLRGCLSQGILLPVRFRPDDDGHDGDHFLVDGEGVGHVAEEGDDVAGLLGVTKWEPPIPAHMAGEVTALGGVVPKYDIENRKAFPDVLVPSEMVALTEKVHGCLHQDSLVRLPDGSELPISRVVGDHDISHVMSFDIDAATYVAKPITGRMRRPNTEGKRWVRLEFENGRKLTLTCDHPIYSKERKAWIPAGEIRPGEDIEGP